MNSFKKRKKYETSVEYAIYFNSNENTLETNFKDNILYFFFSKIDTIIIVVNLTILNFII